MLLSWSECTSQHFWPLAEQLMWTATEGGSPALFSAKYVFQFSTRKFEVPDGARSDFLHFFSCGPDSAGKANRACGCAWVIESGGAALCDCAWHCITGCPANSKHLWSQSLRSPGNSICQAQSVHGSRNAKRSQDL